MTPLELLEDIAKEVSNHTSDPHWLGEKRVDLGGLYSFFSGELERVLFLKPDEWNALRLNTKSDKQADKLWEATEAGKKEVILRMRLKRIEKLLSSMRTMIEILTNEARNQQ